MRGFIQCGQWSVLHRKSVLVEWPRWALEQIVPAPRPSAA